MGHSLFTQLAKRLNLTDLDSQEDEYILTKDEETAVLNSARDQARRHKEYTLTEKGLSKMEILARLSDIDFDDAIDKEQVLSYANSCKHQNLWHEENRRREREQRETQQKEILQRCDAKYMFNLMRWTSQNIYGKKLIVNENNKRLITAVCFFLSRDERFVSELGYSFDKGLLIRGVSGLGKTYVVKCLEKNELNPVSILSMIEISEVIKQSGEYMVRPAKIIYLDDVGTEEPTINHFGTKINFFKQFIENIYLNNNIFNNLIISTNNNFSQIEERYGFRVRSRIKDMFNIIDVSGEDMRG